MFKHISPGDWALILGLIGGFWGYCEYHFAHADVVTPQVAAIIQTQVTGRGERIEFQNKVMDQLQDLKESVGRIEGKLDK